MYIVFWKIQNYIKNLRSKTVVGNLSRTISRVIAVNVAASGAREHLVSVQIKACKAVTRPVVRLWTYLGDGSAQ